MRGCRRTCILSIFRLSLPVTKVILSLSYGSQGLSGGRWASQRRLRSSEDSRRRARRGGGRLAAMRATDRHIGAAQVLRRPRPAVQWLQVWASGIRAPRRAQHGRAACAAAKLGPPVKDDGQRYARQKNLPSTQDLETPSMGRSEPYNGEAAGARRYGLGQRAHAIASRGDEGAVVALRQGALCKTYLLQTARNTALYVP